MQASRYNSLSANINNTKELSQNIFRKQGEFARVYSEILYHGKCEGYYLLEIIYFYIYL